MSGRPEQDSSSVMVGARALRKLREAKRLAASQVAAHAGRSQSALSHYETGQRTPSRGAIRSICQDGMEASISETNAILLAFGYLPIGTLLEQIQAILAADICLTPAGRARLAALVTTELAAAQHDTEPPT